MTEPAGQKNQQHAAIGSKLAITTVVASQKCLVQVITRAEMQAALAELTKVTVESLYT